MTIREEVEKRIRQDPELNRIRRKIENGSATYADTSAYSIRSGKLLGEILSGHILDIPVEDREQLCVDLLHDRYVDINLVVDEVQEALDAAQGLRIAPHHAPENTERSHQIGTSLRDPTKPDDVIQRRAGAATETATKAVHDDRMKSEAKFRKKAGLKSYLNRVAAAGCCPWCSDVAGRYVYGDHPDNIFRRHDNCDCTVTFEDGRKRQDVWSKREWEVPGKDAGAGELHIISGEQFAAIQEINRPMVLTGDADGGIIGINRELKPRSFESIRRFAENDLKLSFSDSLKNVPNETLKVIVDSLHKLNKEIPELSGFVEEVVLSDMNEMAMASLRFEDGNAHAYLKLSSQLFTQYSLDEIDDIIHTLGEAHEISSKNGIYDILKHEYLHFVEYQKTIAKFGGMESRVKESLTRYELASEIKELVFKNLELEQTDEVIKHYISNYATKNAAEFIAEAYSSVDNNIVVNEAKRLIKKKWGV